MKLSTTSDILFKEYAKATSNGEFAPCAIQDKNQAFKTHNTFNDACISLKNMIESFKIEERTYDNEDVFHSKNPNTSHEMKIYSVYF